LTGRPTNSVLYVSVRISVFLNSATASIPFCRPDDQHCSEAQEFDLVRNMLIAAVEERYKDAGELLRTCTTAMLKTVFSVLL
jgi:hypothetical protein